jgi:mitogen-activated protein kinase organizer 1
LGTVIKTYSAHGYEVLSISVWVLISVLTPRVSFIHFIAIAFFFFSAHDNTKFVSSGGDRSVFLWDVTTGNTIRRISAHLTKINVVEFNADASVVASGKSISMLIADGHTPMLTPA